MSHELLPWSELETLAKHLAEPGVEPGSTTELEWRSVEQSLTRLQLSSDLLGIIRLRETFTPLLARDTIGGLAVLKAVDEAAIGAARQLDEKSILAHLLGAKGHNLHRQGYHQEAIYALEESASLYQELGESFSSLKNYYMTCLCHRAMGNRKLAHQIVTTVLQQIETDNPWRGNPLQVMAWLTRDEGAFAESERFLKEALLLQKQGKDPDILVVGTLADLGEVAGLQGRSEEAISYFEESLMLVNKHAGQYNRQEARTKLKYAELLWHLGEHHHAMQLLDQADDQIRAYGHYYDSMWRIEFIRAAIYLRWGQVRNSWRKFRAMWRYRQELKLPLSPFIRNLITRIWRGTGSL